MLFWTAFTLGLFGSLHCLGMCGPIAVSVANGGSSLLNQTIRILLYNSGRLVTYCFIGLVFGFLGEGFLIAGLQKYLSIFLGISLLAIAFFSLNVESYLLKNSFFNKIFFWVKLNLAKLLRSQKQSSPLFTGLVNGLLPCGLVYMAVVGALATDSIYASMKYMAIFGLGTFPIMLATTWSKQMITIKLRNRLQKLYPAFLVAFGILLIMRGANFNLPRGVELLEALRELPMCH